MNHYNQLSNIEKAIVDEYTGRIIRDGVLMCDTIVDAVFFNVDYVKEITESNYGLDVNKPRVARALTALIAEAVNRKAAEA